jgi:starvation-inducible outer membrane lipoprotein
MKALAALLAALLMSACATVPAPTQATAPAAVPTQAATAKVTPATEPQQYPAWLEMKPGYAETCISGGGCVPMTQAELQEMAAEIVQRTLQACRRSSST